MAFCTWRSGSRPIMWSELSATGRVILGMIAIGKQTGYDIKQLVDKSTRHFWAASYGQIYPELKRLEERGLIRGRSEPSGGRARTVYELTDAGRTALLAWLASDAEPLYELRDEGMLKLFFSDAFPERRIENVRQMLRYVSDQLLGTDYGFELPKPLPWHGIYHPDLGHTDLETLLAPKYDPCAARGRSNTANCCPRHG